MAAEHGERRSDRTGGRARRLARQPDEAAAPIVVMRERGRAKPRHEFRAFRRRERDAPDRPLARLGEIFGVAHCPPQPARFLFDQSMFRAERREQLDQFADAMFDRRGEAFDAKESTREFPAHARRNMRRAADAIGRAERQRHRLDRAFASSRRRITTVACCSGLGSSLNVASVTRPSVPCAPQTSLTRSSPVTFFITRPPFLIASPRPLISLTPIRLSRAAPVLIRRGPETFPATRPPIVGSPLVA